MKTLEQQIKYYKAIPGVLDPISIQLTLNTLPSIKNTLYGKYIEQGKEGYISYHSYGKTYVTKMIEVYFRLGVRTEGLDPGTDIAILECYDHTLEQTVDEMLVKYNMFERLGFAQSFKTSFTPEDGHEYSFKIRTTGRSDLYSDYIVVVDPEILTYSDAAFSVIPFEKTFIDIDTYHRYNTYVYMPELHEEELSVYHGYYTKGIFHDGTYTNTQDSGIYIPVLAYKNQDYKIAFDIKDLQHSEDTRILLSLYSHIEDYSLTLSYTGDLLVLDVVDNRGNIKKRSYSKNYNLPKSDQYSIEVISKDRLFEIKINNTRTHFVKTHKSKNASIDLECILGNSSDYNQGIECTFLSCYVLNTLV